jgi:hypothetical protein
MWTDVVAVVAPAVLQSIRRSLPWRSARYFIARRRPFTPICTPQKNQIKTNRIKYSGCDNRVRLQNRSETMTCRVCNTNVNCLCPIRKPLLRNHHHHHYTTTQHDTLLSFTSQSRHPLQQQLTRKTPALSLLLCIAFSPLCSSSSPHPFPFQYSSSYISPLSSEFRIPQRVPQTRQLTLCMRIKHHTTPP